MRTDGQLQRDIRRHLLAQPETANADIFVSVDHGVATLSGTVGSSVVRNLAESAVESVLGVPPLVEGLTVKPNNRSSTCIAR
jgi:osmotically-inducible protein OsmY